MTCFKETKLIDALNWIPSIKRIKPVDIEKYTVSNAQKYPFYGQQLMNNGIVDYIAVDDRFLNNKNSSVYLLIASNNHSINIVTTPFYIKEDHAATSTIGHPKMTRLSALYIKGSIQRVFDTSFDYNAKALQGVLQNTLVTLPFISNDSNKLDWNYMEQYVKCIEKQYVKLIEEQYVKHIEGYLVNLGYKSINEVIFSKKDEEVILRHNQAIFKEFSISDLFEIKTPMKKFNAQNIKFVENGFPYVVRSNENNGIRGEILEDIKYLNEGNTISFGQDTATIFYQRKPYFTGDKIKILSPKFNGFNSKKAQYIITVMKKSFSNFSWGSSSFNVNVLNNVKVQLPLNTCNEIDFELMELYIKTVEKKTVKKLRAEMDINLKAMNQIISKENKI